MSKLVNETIERIDGSEPLRVALLSGASFLLGLLFVALLASDEAHAAVF
ncbi:MAG TPA: hypothetical protein VFC31_05745 [Candidatus Limnocylindria bacterium]|nr:hypothetical protein [Candidatus Limnocylindria bacterium]